MSYNETLEALLQQQKEIQQKINAQISAERNERIASIVADMAKYHITAAELEKASRIKTPAPPRYRNPQTGATWSGHGKRPKWVLEAQAAGKSLEDFLIRK